MKHFLSLLLTLTFCLPVAAQMTPEEEELLRMYGATDEYIEQQRQVDEILEKSMAAQEKEKQARALMVALSLAVALVPVVIIGKRIITQPEAYSPEGKGVAMAIALAGGTLLFAVNYGWMYLRLKAGDALNFPLAILVTLGIAGGAIYLMKKTDKKEDA